MLARHGPPISKRRVARVASRRGVGFVRRATRAPRHEMLELTREPSSRTESWTLNGLVVVAVGAALERERHRRSLS